jgi:hypothetical protein
MVRDEFILQQRYCHDVVFRRIVDSMTAMLLDGTFTKESLLEAVELAARLFTEELSRKRR